MPLPNPTFDGLRIGTGWRTGQTDQTVYDLIEVVSMSPIIRVGRRTLIRHGKCRIG